MVGVAMASQLYAIDGFVMKQFRNLPVFQVSKVKEMFYCLTIIMKGCWFLYIV